MASLSILKGEARRATLEDFENVARRLGIETAALRAVWEVEAGGRPFRRDGSLTRRFEPHHFPGTGMDWRESLKIKASEREAMLRAAWAKDPTAAARATSFGGPQIMGFNAGRAGFPNPIEMVKAMAESEAAQLDGFATFAAAMGIATKLRAHDWKGFGKVYNGGGQPEVYARKVETAYRRLSGKASPVVLRAGSKDADAVCELQRALGIVEDGIFAKATDAAVRASSKAPASLSMASSGKRYGPPCACGVRRFPRRSPIRSTTPPGSRAMPAPRRRWPVRLRRSGTRSRRRP